ncbi:MAG TPA: hypothetical protein VJS44_06110 [Pyrinomonadaceae bacterium]|nr:hypothetical protein [Pyrinomonadaceae bacterium]
MSDPRLKYAISSSPDPMQVGPQNGTSNDPSLATLTIVVSNPKGLAVSCKSIQFVFLQGTNARDFFADSTGIGTSAPTGWHLVQDKNGFEFDATPDTPEDGEIGPDGVVFTISDIPVNTQFGTTPLTVIEETTDSSGSTITGTQEIDLAKFPQNFEVSDLTLPSYEVPPIDFGGSVTLNWVGTSGATYELRYQDNHDQTVTISETEDGQPLPSSGSYEIDDLEKDTTFYLLVTLSETGQGPPPTLERFLTVQVNEPLPVINSFTYTATQTKLILRWDTSHADKCSITGDSAELNPSSTDDSYSRTWPDTNVGNGVYTLTASSSVLAGDNSASQTIHTIPVINSFTASTTGPIDWYVPVTFQWDTDYAETVTITPNVGQVQGKGSVVVYSRNNTTYTLTCTGFGPDVTAPSITVQVKSVQVTSFLMFFMYSADGNYSGSTLSWTTERATGVSIPELNFVADTFHLDKGSTTSQPFHEKLTLVCDGPNGPVQVPFTMAEGNPLGGIYWDGMKLKDESTGILYLVLDGVLRDIQSNFVPPESILGIFNSDQAVSIPSTVGYTIGQPLQGSEYLVVADDGTLYFLIDNVKRMVTSGGQARFGFRREMAYPFSVLQPSPPPDGPPLT